MPVRRSNVEEGRKWPRQVDRTRADVSRLKDDHHGTEGLRLFGSDTDEEEQNKKCTIL